MCEHASLRDVTLPSISTKARMDWNLDHLDGSIKPDVDPIVLNPKYLEWFGSSYSATAGSLNELLPSSQGYSDMRPRIGPPYLRGPMPSQGTVTMAHWPLYPSRHTSYTGPFYK